MAVWEGKQSYTNLRKKWKKKEEKKKRDGGKKGVMQERSITAVVSLGGGKGGEGMARCALEKRETTEGQDWGTDKRN